MYSVVSICKVCQRRVLDEQLNMSYYGHPNKCIYCLVKFFDSEIIRLTRFAEDKKFAFTILEHSYSEVHAAYEAAISDNKLKLDEISKLRQDLLLYLNTYGNLPYVDPNDPMRLKY